MQSNILQILFPARIISDNSIILLIPLQKKRKRVEILSIIFLLQALAVLIPSVVQSVYIRAEWFHPGLEPRKSVAHLHPPQRHTHTHAHPLTLSLFTLFSSHVSTQKSEYVTPPPPPRCDGAPTPCQTPGGAALNRTWVAFFLSEAGTPSVPAVTEADVLGQCHLRPSPCITSLLFDLPLLLSVPHSFSSSVSLSILHRALNDLASKCFHHDRLLYACIIVGKEKSERLLSVNRFCQRRGDETG